mmetsp:Transcript_41782/g.110117  ORF Transcript_41782/g.110117 Transcript_41782/m.110117 type:complete len:268 (+) Transcript_41782:940-1743(+)
MLPRQRLVRGTVLPSRPSLACPLHAARDAGSRRPGRRAPGRGAVPVKPARAAASKVGGGTHGTVGGGLWGQRIAADAPCSPRFILESVLLTRCTRCGSPKTGIGPGRASHAFGKTMPRRVGPGGALLAVLLAGLAHKIAWRGRLAPQHPRQHRAPPGTPHATHRLLLHHPKLHQIIIHGPHRLRLAPTLRREQVAPRRPHQPRQVHHTIPPGGRGGTLQVDHGKLPGPAEHTVLLGGVRGGDAGGLVLGGDGEGTLAGPLAPPGYPV